MLSSADFKFILDLQTAVTTQMCNAVWILSTAVFLKSIPSLSILDLVPEPSCKAEKITQRISVSNGEKHFHLQPARVEGWLAVTVLLQKMKTYS